MKSYNKSIIIAILSIALLCVVSIVITKKPNMPDEYKIAIDSINIVNSKLIQKQKSLDSLIRAYEKQVKSIDTKIDNIKEKTTIIKEYYHEISQQTSHYNANQIDSFFKSKYDY